MHDIQTKEKFYFLCRNWLSVENGDGKIVRGLFVACDKQMNEFKLLIKKQAKNYLKDNHLWLSVFYKPTQSTFSRLERVTCCFVFHFLAMVLNILFYKFPFLILSNSIQMDLILFQISVEQVS